MIDGFLRGLRQPEYVHVLLNPLPVYGLLISWIALIAALISKSRRAHIVTLILVFITSISAWPVFEFGEQGYDRVLAMTDDDGHAWLDEHQERAEKVIYIFYALATLSVTAISRWYCSERLRWALAATSHMRAEKSVTGNFATNQRRR